VLESAQILILGAGLSGLSTARHLGAGCRVIEREGEPGGLARTRWERGYGFDYTGHLMHLRDPSIRRWVTRLVRGESTWIQRRSRIWSHGVYTRYPYQANTFGLPPQVAHECLMGFLEARDADVEIRSFEDFILAHFGAGFARHFMIPYNTKIWGVHPREMTPAWCDRFVPVPDLGDVIAGAVGMHEKEMGYNASFLYPDAGIGELTRRIAGDVERKVDVEYGQEVRAVATRSKMVRLGRNRWMGYDALVSTLPLDTLVRRIEDAPKWVRESAARLRVRSLRYLDVALREPAGTLWHWTYVPDLRVPFYRVGSYSNFSSQLVPEGGGSLYVELTSPRSRPLSKLLSGVVPHLVEMGIIRRRRDIRFARLRVIPHAYVVYDHGWERHRERLLGWLRKRDIHSIGRYGDWNYSAMEDALIAGRETARVLKETR